MDEVPDEIVDAAVELADEVAEGVEGCEDSELELEEVATEDEDIKTMVSDAVNKALRDAGIIKDEEEEDFKEIEDSLEMKDVDGEESVTIDPQEVSDSSKAIKAIITTVKPLVGSVKDKAVRKAIVDSITKLAKLSMEDTNTADAYSGIMSARRNNKKAADKKLEKDPMLDDYYVGSEIAKRFNPHYKEVK